MIKVPTRTLVLMVLTLLAFVWFWVQTHRPPRPEASTTIELLGPLDAGEEK